MSVAPLASARRAHYSPHPTVEMFRSLANAEKTDPNQPRDRHITPVTGGSSGSWKQIPGLILLL